MSVAIIFGHDDRNTQNGWLRYSHILKIKNKVLNHWYIRQTNKHLEILDNFTLSYNSLYQRIFSLWRHILIQFFYIKWLVKPHFYRSKTLSLISEKNKGRSSCESQLLRNDVKRHAMTSHPVLRGVGQVHRHLYNVLQSYYWEIPPDTTNLYLRLLEKSNFIPDFRMLTYRFLPLSRPLSGFLGVLVMVQQVARVRVKNYTQ